MKYDSFKNVNNKFLISESDMLALKKYNIDVYPVRVCNVLKIFNS